MDELEYILSCLYTKDSKFMDAIIEDAMKISDKAGDICTEELCMGIFIAVILSDVDATAHAVEAFINDHVEERA